MTAHEVGSDGTDVAQSICGKPSAVSADSPDIAGEQCEQVEPEG
jgi:hypothetical protein